MSESYNIRPILDEEEWDNFVLSSLGNTPFSTSKWMKCAEKALNGKHINLGLFKDERLFAGLTGITKRRGPFKQLETPELTPHTGILLAPVIGGKGPSKLEAEWHRALEQFTNFLTTNYDHVRLTHSPSLNDLRPFIWSGWDLRLRYTYHLPLDDLDMLWERIERRTRTAIRKAEKLGYIFAETDDVDLLCKQYRMIYNNQDKRPPVSSIRIESFIKATTDANMTRLFVVQAPDGQTASIVAFVEDAETSYAWIAGADPRHSSSGATSLLYWKYLKQCKRKRFDFVGANFPAIAFFKRGLGGDLVPYYSTEGYGNQFLKIATRFKRLL